ncbi:MAG: hypothetical protein ACK5NY_09625 [Burkholderiaceae bacterium]
MFNLFKSKFSNCDDWIEGTTKKKDRRFYKTFANMWLNVVILQNKKVFITHGGEIIKNSLIWDENKKEDILECIHDLVFYREYKLKNKIKYPNLWISEATKRIYNRDIDNEPKAFEDMKPHEKLIEIGRRENIKYQKQKKLNDEEYEKLSKEFDKFLGL